MSSRRGCPWVSCPRVPRATTRRPYAESIRRIVAASRIAQGKRLAVLLVLEDAQHLLAAANAVARALPLYYRGKVSLAPKAVTLMAVGPGNETIALPKLVRYTLEASREAARLVDTAPSDLGPDAFQAEAWKLLDGAPRVTLRAIAGALSLPALAPARSRQQAGRLLVPGVAQSGDPVEDWLVGAVVDPIGNKIAVPFELQFVVRPGACAPTVPDRR